MNTAEISTTPNTGPPAIGSFGQWFGKTIFKAMGWQMEGAVPTAPKFVGIVAPHTSNWDFIIMLMMAYSIDIKPNFIAKDLYFIPPLGWLARALGGIPVDRSKRQNRVELSAEKIRASEQIALGITPEGTRKKTTHWKSGFYHMARLGKAPILMIGMDYRRKTVILADPFFVSDDMQADLEKIRTFYAPITAKFPHQVGEIQFRSRTAS